MELKELNLEAIINLLEIEIENYYSKQQEQKLKKSDINLIKDTISLLETNDYTRIDDNFILVDMVIKMFLGSNEKAAQTISDKVLKANTICQNYNINPKKYDEKEYEKQKKYIEKIKKLFENELIKENAKLLSLMPEVTEKEINVYKEIADNLKHNYYIWKKYKGNCKFKKREETLVTAYHFSLLEKLFDRKHLSDKEKIILFEHLHNHNNTVYYNNSKIDSNKKDRIINIVEMGYEKFNDISWIDNERKKELKELIQIIREQGIDEITIDMLPKYNGDLSFDNNYTISEIKYFYITLLKIYQNDLLDEQEELQNYNNYSNKEDRITLVEMYKETIKNYLTIRKVMDTELAKYYEEYKRIQDDQDVNKLFYCVKPSGRPYLSDDVKSQSFPKDAYNGLRELLVLFKKGKLMPSQSKELTESNKVRGYSEIRDDQIRIIYKNIKDNEYAIIGAFIKKEDNPKDTYPNMCKRNQDLLISDEVFEKDFFEELTENAHKGGRRFA